MLFNLKYIAVRKPPKRMKSHIVASILYIGIAQFKKLGSIRHGSILLAAHLSNISVKTYDDQNRIENLVLLEKQCAEQKEQRDERTVHENG